jgi:hypothetical protein
MVRPRWQRAAAIRHTAHGTQHSAACASGLSLALLECRLTGPFAWFGGEPGQVGNEAAIVV